MSSALADPPDCGVRKSADAPVASARTPATEAAKAMAKTRRRVREWGSAKAGGILFMRRSSAARPSKAGSAAKEIGLALGEERSHAFGEITGRHELLLDPRLELELLVQARVEPGVEL